MKNYRYTIALIQFIFVLSFIINTRATEQWTKEKANQWYESIGWRVGCNFIPSTAINQIEMWQADTFDSQTIEKELKMANDIGFNTLRVFLHYLAWGEDKDGFKLRMKTFLNITEQFNMQITFVFFDDCWNLDPHIRLQPNPIPGVHNSGWVQCPGNAIPIYGEYQEYVHDILTEFANDSRVLFWDLYNEPGNSKHDTQHLGLLQDIFSYARQVNISQPITAGICFQLKNSDIITFHKYSIPIALEIEIQLLKSYGRPIICTEYMARTVGSTFQNSLPIFKRHNVGAINWGLVFGKTQTVFPWNSPQGSLIPQLWFHDVFWKNGTCFSDEECKFIKKITNEKRQSIL